MHASTVPGAVCPKCCMDIFMFNLRSRYYNPRLPDENVRPREEAESQARWRRSHQEPGLCLCPSCVTPLPSARPGSPTIPQGSHSFSKK